MDTGTPLIRLVSDIPVLPSMNLTSALALPKGQEDKKFEGQVLQGNL